MTCAEGHQIYDAAQEKYSRIHVFTALRRSA